MHKNGLIIFLACVSVWCFGQDSFATGENLFMQNKPKDAAVYLESSIAEDPGRVQAYLYLGIAYEQLERTDEAIAVYRQILDQAGDLTANIANNLGNMYFRKGAAPEADAMYSRALEADRVFASAYLGRANARLKRGFLREAVSDYEQYLLLEPRSPQKPAIERLLVTIKAEFAEAERQRLVAEEAERAKFAEAEQKRLAAEAAERAEIDRRQRLLDEVTASLQGAAGASQGISTGAEDVEGYEGEFELQ